jgi:hypothetical protein
MYGIYKYIRYVPDRSSLREDMHKTVSLFVLAIVCCTPNLSRLQRIRCAGREICLAFPFCLDDKIVNVIPSFPASEEMEKLVWQRRFQTTKS